MFLAIMVKTQEDATRCEIYPDTSGFLSSWNTTKSCSLTALSPLLKPEWPIPFPAGPVPTLQSSAQDDFSPNTENIYILVTWRYWLSR